MHFAYYRTNYNIMTLVCQVTFLSFDSHFFMILVKIDTFRYIFVHI